MSTDAPRNVFGWNDAQRANVRRILANAKTVPDAVPAAAPVSADRSMTRPATPGQRADLVRQIAERQRGAGELATEIEEILTSGVEISRETYSDYIARLSTIPADEPVRVLPGQYLISGLGAYRVDERGAVFHRSTDATVSAERAERVLAVVSDPGKAREAAAAIGKAYGMCGRCGRFLDDPKSLARGMGPICAAAFDLFAALDQAAPVAPSAAGKARKASDSAPSTTGREGDYRAGWWALRGAEMVFEPVRWTRVQDTVKDAILGQLRAGEAIAVTMVNGKSAHLTYSFDTAHTTHKARIEIAISVGARTGKMRRAELRVSGHGTVVEADTLSGLVELFDHPVIIALRGGEGTE